MFGSSPESPRPGRPLPSSARIWLRPPYPQAGPSLDPLGPALPEVSRILRRRTAGAREVPPALVLAFILSPSRSEHFAPAHLGSSPRRTRDRARSRVRFALRSDRRAAGEGIGGFLNATFAMRPADHRHPARAPDLRSCSLDRGSIVGNILLVLGAACWPRPEYKEQTYNAAVARPRRHADPRGDRLIATPSALRRAVRLRRSAS